MSVPLYDLEHDLALVAWRTLSFERMGIPMDDAMLMARRRDVDTDDVRKMLERGATVEQAMAIRL